MREAIRRLLTFRSRHYKACFQRNSRSAEVVLGDLADFCCAYETTHQNDDIYNAVQLEGRRQVFLRIRYYLGLSQSDIEEYAKRVQEEERGLHVVEG